MLPPVPPGGPMASPLSQPQSLYVCSVISATDWLHHMSFGDALSSITLDAPENAIGLGYVKTPADALRVHPVGFPAAPLSNDPFTSRFAGAPAAPAMTTSKTMPPSRQDTF